LFAIKELKAVWMAHVGAPQGVVKLSFTEDGDRSSKNMEWHQWTQEVGKISKLVQCGSVADCFRELSKRTPYILKHLR